MPTGTLGVAARQDPRQVLNTLKKTVNFGDLNIGVGVAFDNYLPQGAFICEVFTEIVTTFNGGTNALTVGTVGAAYNNIVSAADVNPAIAGVYQSTRGAGRGLTAAAAVLPVARYVQTGGAATQGQAIVLINFEGGWAS